MTEDGRKPEPHYSNVVSMVAGAKPADVKAPAADAPSPDPRAPDAADIQPADAAPTDEKTGGGGGGGAETHLPEGCPVIPLGSNGDMYYFLDHRRAFRPMGYEKLLRAGPNTLLGPESGIGGWAWRTFPTFSKDDGQSGWSEKNCGRAFLIAASSLDVWKGLDRVRGAGCWKGEDGELIVHLGNQLLVNGKAREPGVIGRHVFPADDAQPRPWHTAVEGGPEGPADALLGIFSTWNFVRPFLDPMLLLGWCGAAMLGGALDWRPSVVVTGDQGTGKSTLETLIHKNLIGGMVHASDASAAALWTALGYSSVPIALDEFESDGDERRMQGLVNLMRLASSGGVILRGSADHKLAQFQARSAFLFSGINPPPLKPQDLSRLAILELRPLNRDGAMPDIAAPRIRELGAKLKRRMIDNWYRWPKVLGAYHAALKKHGHDSRGADQFGALMASAEVLLRDEADFTLERVDSICAELAAASLSETAGIERQHDRCLAFIMSALCDQWSGGKQRTVAQHLRTVIRDTDILDSVGALGRVGLRFVHYDGNPYLAVANGSHQGVQRLFAGSDWKSGGHMRLLRRFDGYVVPKGPALSIGGVQTRATLLPIELCLDVKLIGQEERGEWVKSDGSGPVVEEDIPF